MVTKSKQSIQQSGSFKQIVWYFLVIEDQRRTHGSQKASRPYNRVVGSPLVPPWSAKVNPLNSCCLTFQLLLHLHPGDVNGDCDDIYSMSKNKSSDDVDFSRRFHYKVFRLHPPSLFLTTDPSLTSPVVMLLLPMMLVMITDPIE